MLKLSRRTASVLLGCALLSGAARPAAQTRTNADAAVLADFQKRIDSYLELRNRLRKDAPPLKETKDPAEIQASQKALAAKLQAARKDARPGDILTPEIRRLLQRLMYPETKGAEAREVKESIKEDAPKDVPLKVNAEYPDNAPLPTVPPNLLAALPRLPKDLEYRFIDRHLILRDVHANIIVDFAPNALQ